MDKKSQFSLSFRSIQSKYFEVIVLFKYKSGSKILKLECGNRFLWFISNFYRLF